MDAEKKEEGNTLDNFMSILTPSVITLLAISLPLTSV